MKHWTLAALGLATLAVIGLVLWNLRGGDGAASSTVEASSGAARSPGSAITPGASGIASGGPNTPVSPGNGEVGDEPAPLADEVARTTTMENFLAGDVPRRLLEMASSCYNTGFSYKQLEADGASIDLDYVIEVKAGVASIRNVTLKQGMGKPELEDCILEVVDGMHWNVSMASDFTQPASYGIDLLALKKFGEPLPHERDAEQPVNTDDEFGPLVRKRNQ